MGDTTLTPTRLLNGVSRIIPGAWASVRCDDGWARVLCDADRITRTHHRPASAYQGDLVAIACLAAWRLAQPVYRFDPALEDSLRETELAGRIPADTLLRLPHRGVWIDMHRRIPNGLSMSGFMAAVFGRTGEAPMLVALAAIGPDAASPSFPGVIVSLDRNVEDVVAATSANAPELAEAFPHMLAALLYLSSDEPDIDGEARLVRRRSAAANHPTIIRVGWRIGAALRLARSARSESAGAGAGASPAPHIRRAHWHTYWTGAHGSPERRRALKWLPPIPVNVASPDDIVPTVRKVDGATHPPRCRPAAHSNGHAEHTTSEIEEASK
jgi:hypothetical protein